MRWRSTPACAVALRTPTPGAELGAGQPWWLPGYLHDRTARCCSVLKMLDRLLEEGNEALAHERAAFELERKEMKTERSTLSGDCIVRSAAALQPEGVTIQWRENRHRSIGLSTSAPGFDTPKSTADHLGRNPSAFPPGSRTARSSPAHDSRCRS